MEMNIENLKVGDVQEHQRKMVAEGSNKAQQQKATTDHSGERQ